LLALVLIGPVALVAVALRWGLRAAHRREQSDLLARP
jgi:hypothetical protein